MNTINSNTSEVMNVTVNEQEMNKSIKAENLVFFEKNRDINISNVRDMYNILKSVGFQKSLGTIDYLQGSVIENEPLCLIEVVKINNNKKWSLSNFKLVSKPFNYCDGAKSIADGQHKAIALQLLKLIDGKDLDNPDNYKEVVLPDNFKVNQYVYMRNSGKPWNRNDGDKSELTTGNEIIDKMVSIANKKELHTQVVIDFGTIGLPNITAKTVTGLRSKTKKLSKALEEGLTSKCIEELESILGAIDNSPFLTRSNYNSTRVSAGLKAFGKAHSFTNVLEVISMIDKTVWEELFTPKTGTSPEAKFYTDALETLFNRKNEEAA